MICHNKCCKFWIKEFNSCEKEANDELVVDENGNCETQKMDITKLSAELERLDDG